MRSSLTEVLLVLQSILLDDDQRYCDSTLDDFVESAIYSDEVDENSMSCYKYWRFVLATRFDKHLFFFSISIFTTLCCRLVLIFQSFQNIVRLTFLNPAYSLSI